MFLTVIGLSNFKNLSTSKFSKWNDSKNQTKLLKEWEEKALFITSILKMLVLLTDNTETKKKWQVSKMNNESGLYQISIEKKIMYLNS